MARQARRGSRPAVWLALILAAVALAPIVLSSAAGAQWASSQVTAAIPGSVELRGLAVGWTSGLEVASVTLFDPGGAEVARAEGISAPQLTAWALATGRRDPGPVIVERLEAQVVMNTHGLSNLERALVDPMAPPAQAASASPLAALFGLTLNKGSVTLDDPVAGRIGVEGLSLASIQIGSSARFEASASIDHAGATGQVRATGEVTGLDQTSEAWRLDARVEAVQVPLALADILGAGGLATALLGDKADLEATVSGSPAAPEVELTAEAPYLSAHLTVASAQDTLTVSPGSSAALRLTPAGWAALADPDGLGAGHSLSETVAVEISIARMQAPIYEGVADLSAAVGEATLTAGPARWLDAAGEEVVWVGGLSGTVTSERDGRRVNGEFSAVVGREGSSAQADLDLEMFRIVGPPNSNLRGGPPTARAEISIGDAPASLIEALAPLPIPAASLLGDGFGATATVSLQGSPLGAQGSFEAALASPLLDIAAAGTMDASKVTLDPERTRAEFTVAHAAAAAAGLTAAGGPALRSPSIVRLAVEHASFFMGEEGPDRVDARLALSADELALAHRGADFSLTSVEADLALAGGATVDHVDVDISGGLLAADGEGSWSAAVHLSGAPLAPRAASLVASGLSPLALAASGLPAAAHLGGPADLEVDWVAGDEGSLALAVQSPALDVEAAWEGGAAMTLAEPGWASIRLTPESLAALRDEFSTAGVVEEEEEGRAPQLELAGPVELSATLDRFDFTMPGQGPATLSLAAGLAAPALDLRRGVAPPVALEGLSADLTVSAGLEGSKVTAHSRAAIPDEGGAGLLDVYWESRILPSEPQPERVPITLSARAEGMPTAALDALWGTSGLIGAMLGPRGDAILALAIPAEGEGAMSVDLGGGRSFARAVGRAGAEVLLDEDGHASLEVTPALAERLLALVNPFAVTAFEAEEPVRALLAGESFVLPIYPYSLAGVVADLEVEIGWVTLTPGGPLKAVLDALGERQEETTRAEFSPARLHLENGVVTYERMTVTTGSLVAHLEGAVDVVARTLDLRMTLPRDTLRSALGDLDPYLSESFELVVPIRGTLDEPRVDQGAIKEVINDLLAELALRALGSFLLGAL